jgi:acyl carrier protein
MLNQAFTEGEILKLLEEELRLILDEAGRPARRVSAEDRLGDDLGLKSLDLARLVAALEVQTGADPFQELVSITSIRTIGDLLEAYRRFFADDGGEHDGELLAAQQRAMARKNDRSDDV